MAGTINNMFVPCGVYLRDLLMANRVLMVPNGELKIVDYQALPALATCAVKKCIVVVLASERGAMMNCLELSEDPMCPKLSEMTGALDRMRSLYMARPSLFAPEGFDKTRMYVLIYGYLAGIEKQLEHLFDELKAYELRYLVRQFTIHNECNGNNKLVLVHNGTVMAEETVLPY